LLLIRACRDGETRQIDGVIFSLAHPDPDLDRDAWDPTVTLRALSVAYLAAVQVRLMRIATT
jgi:hypothetical protein